MNKIIKNISIIISIFLNKIFFRRPDFSEKKIFLQGQVNEQENNKKDVINNFKDIEFSVFSQFGEDGIISWIINKLPKIEKIFLEIGTQDYWESNTRFLLKSKNWKGYLIEASEKDVGKIKSQKIYWQHNVKAIHAFANAENINEIIKKNIEEKEIGLLSIDIDGNDYWIIEKINNLSPKIIVCEFNSVFGDLFNISVPYEDNFNRSKKHYSNLYFGASINALISLLKNKGYFFLGTGSFGVNAFFVKNEFQSHFENIIKENKIFPSQSRESLDYKGKKTFKNIYNARIEINDLEVFDFDEKKLKKISEYSELYSENWKNIFKK